MTLNRHEKALELDKILHKLAKCASCEETKQMALSIRPAETFREALSDLQQTADAHMLSNRFGTPSIYEIEPCTNSVGRARIGAMLSMRELLDIAYILRTSRTLLSWKKQAETETSIDYLFSQLSEDRTLENDITSSILSEEEIADNASPALADIRRKIRHAGQRARDQLDKMVRSTAYQKILQEQIVTIRNGRFVVPVKSEHRNEVKGLVHDTSASGSTLFIEPIGVVEANNLIRELESREQHEIDRILHEFSARVGNMSDLLLTNYNTILELDLLFAKSRLADAMRAGAPTLIEQGETVLRRARHPLLNAETIVPIDISLGGEFDTLVITGPNTGGKTVALKTLGLLTLMAMCGLFIPAADSSVVCFYPKVLADIGDEQSIEQSLSTFSSHMINIISILQQADEQALVLIDELGAGTDPVEGAALAVAIITHLRNAGAKIVATTHYAEIKMFALQTPGVENGSCEFDVATLRPTYRLLIGVPGRSNAFAISERLGLPIDIIEAAKEQVSHENARFEDIVSNLEATRQELEREKELAENLRRETENMRKQTRAQQAAVRAEADKELQRARDKARSIIEQVKYQSDLLLTELEELKKQKDQADFSANVRDTKATFNLYMRELEEKADPVIPKKQPKYRLPRKLRQGDTVYLNEFATEGTVLDPPDNAGYVRVQAGILKTKVHQDSLQLIDASKKKVTFTGGGVRTKGAISSAKANANSEVDLRGMDTSEAIFTLDQYLDTAVLSGLKTVTIIHGKGTGALRAAVTAHLKRHRAIRTFRAGTYGEGDAGVTVAEIK